MAHLVHVRIDRLVDDIATKDATRSIDWPGTIALGAVFVIDKSATAPVDVLTVDVLLVRSEERRVGKEC